MSIATSLNPYAPPPGPVQIDFREAAVEESLRILEAGHGRTADELGVSLVLPSDVSGPATLRQIARMTLLRLIFGGGGIVAGGILAGLHKTLNQQWQVPDWRLAAIAGICSFGGIGLLLANAFLVRQTVQRALGDRYRALLQHSTFRPPLCVGVEDCRTFARAKLAPEDCAYLAFDTAKRRLILEGLIFRYVIYAHDCLTVGQTAAATSTGVQIVFRVGVVVVGITLQYDSLWHELKKHTSFAGKDPLLVPIQQVLGSGV
jgi:MFS family permease